MQQTGAGPVAQNEDRRQITLAWNLDMLPRIADSSLNDREILVLACLGW